MSAPSNYIFYSGSNIVLQSGSITPFALPATYVVFSGSIAGITGPYYAINGLNNNIDFNGSASTVINSALSNGGVVFLKAATYRINSSINMPDNSELRGEGRNSTILSVNADPCIISKNASTTNPNHNIIIRDLSLNGSVITSNNSGSIALPGVYDCLIENCDISGSRGFGGIYIGSPSQNIAPNQSRNIVKNNYVIATLTGSGTSGEGIFITGIQQIYTLLDGNICAYNSSNGIEVEDQGNNCIITNNILFGNSSGISVATCSGSIFSNNICSRNLAFGINTSVDSKFLSIKGNYCQENSSDGIVIPSSGSIISNNSCINNNLSNGANQSGIRVSASGLVLTNNNCVDNRTSKTQVYGIFLDAGADYCVVQGNNCHTNKTAGIFVNTIGNNVIGNNIV